MNTSVLTINVPVEVPGHVIEELPITLWFVPMSAHYVTVDITFSVFPLNCSEPYNNNNNNPYWMTSIKLLYSQATHLD